MELYHRIDLATSEKCYERGRIRSVIVDEWERLVQACDDDGILRVKDVPSDVAGDDCGSHHHNHQEAGNSIGATAGKKHAGDDDVNNTVMLLRNAAANAESGEMAEGIILDVERM